MNNLHFEGSSHHFDVAANQNDENPSSWKRLGRLLPISRVASQVTKPSWELARDISMNVLSRRATKLSFKEREPQSNSIDNRQSTRNSLVYEQTQLFKKPITPRIPRMPTEKETIQMMISHKLICAVCEGPCIGDYLRCRICSRDYHWNCLRTSGYITNVPFSGSRLGNHNWSCSSCRDFTNLITQSELENLMSAFEYIDHNKDGYIVLDEYLSFEAENQFPDGFQLFVQHNKQLGEFYFNLMDAHRTGAVGWSDFSFFYCCKLVVAKTKTELAMKLTDHELATAKKIFFKDPRKTFDNERNILITREYFRKVLMDLLESLKKKFGENFVTTILDCDQYEKESESGENVMVNWEEYLRETAVLFLLNRENDNKFTRIERRVDIPEHLKGSIAEKEIPLFENKGRDVSTGRSQIAMTSFLPNIEADKNFLKFAQIMEKLKKCEQKDREKRRFTGSLVDYSIVENDGEESDICLPKLKTYSRDDRKVVTDPWTAVKDLQRVRNQPIPLRTRR